MRPPTALTEAAPVECTTFLPRDLRFGRVDTPIADVCADLRSARKARNGIRRPLRTTREHARVGMRWGIRGKQVREPIVPHTAPVNARPHPSQRPAEYQRREDRSHSVPASRTRLKPPKREATGAGTCPNEGLCFGPDNAFFPFSWGIPSEITFPGLKLHSPGDMGARSRSASGHGGQIP